MSSADRSPVAAGALSGALAALALPPYHLWPLAFVALAPLAWAVGPRRAGSGGIGAVRAGLAFGAVFYGLLLHWVPATAHGMTPAGGISGVLAIAILAGVGAVQGRALHGLRVGWRASPIVALPLVWGVTEAVLAHAGPLAFPWLPLGLSLAAVPELAGVAEWGGARGASLWIAAVNGGVVAAIGAGAAAGHDARASGRRRLALAVGTVGLLAVPAGWSLARAQSLPIRPLPPVLVAQMAIPRDTLLEPEARDRAAARSLAGFAEGRRAEAGPPGERADPVLALLPEAPFASTWNGEVEAAFTRLARALEMPLLAGAHRVEAPPREVEGGPGDRDPRNEVRLVEPDGSGRPIHAKVRLVPGIERPGLAVGPAGGATAVAGVRLGALVCFEAAFDGEARRLRAEGAELLFNPSNDGWFRPARRWLAPPAAHAQHRAHLVLRAVETRAGAIRASLGGELLVVDPVGHATLSRPPGGEGLLPVRPATSPVRTAYVRFGDAGAWGVLLALGVLAGAGARRRLPGIQGDEGPGAD